ncbi:DUF1283 domain-containing protein [Cedecea sp.]|uniref:DUF1283 domain-containing protein n=1 Tax=Cedecea sp. TaxID=1970739 RepID=UPI0012AD8C65|nr:DUF1283 domain-containing protein [Enterobacteriaceae bacterium RIT693]
MNSILRKSLSWMPLALLGAAFMVSVPVQADTNFVVVQPGSGNAVGGQENSLTRQRAAEEKEQWNDTRTLRHKINRHNEKVFDRESARGDKNWDKQDAAQDNFDKCQQSANVNVYWEPNTLRCLDRRTGRVANP